MWFAAPSHGFTRRFLLAGLLVLAAAAPSFGDDTGDYQRIEFTSLDTAAPKLSGLLLKPAGDGPFPAVVMLHGCAGMLTKSGKLSKRPTFWSKWLMERGYLVLLADSFTARGLKSICRTRERPITPENERPYDAFGALTYLQSRPDVRPDKVALMGWSNGAMAGLHAIRDGSPSGRMRPSAPTALGTISAPPSASIPAACRYRRFLSPPTSQR